MPTWAQWISAHRKHKGLSKKQLAEAIGVDEHSVGNWENRGMPPGKAARNKMTELFGEKL